MNDRREVEPQVELTTTRVGGGGKARLAALVAVIMLVGVVYVGVTGRAPAPAQRPTATATAPAVAAFDTPTPASRPSARPTTDGTRITTVQQIRRDPNAPRPYEYIGTGLVLAGREYLADLEPIRPDYLYGAYRIPFPRPATTGTIELAQINSTVSHDIFNNLGRWDFSLDPLTPETRLSGTVLSVTEPPRPEVADAPDLVHKGYSITVRAESRLSFGVLIVEVRIGRPFYSNEGYTIDTTVGRRHFVATLSRVEPWRFVGSIVLPDSLPMRALPFRLRAVPMADPLIGRITVDTFSIPLPPPREFSAVETLLDVSFAPRPIRPGEAQIAAGGYRLIARSNAVKGDRFTEFELLLDPIADPRLAL